FWCLDDFSDFVSLIIGQFTGALIEVKTEDFANLDSESSANTLDASDSISESLFALNICVQNTNDVSELISFL
ncbi:hypothetical protein G0P98_28545, partial [Yangia sp. PrR004]|nr:hypothetical protein [Salipiger sp. PrR004]